MSSAPARTGVRVRRPALAFVGIPCVLFGIPVLSAAGPAAAASAMNAAASLVSVHFAVTTKAGAALEPPSFVSAGSAAAPPFSGADAVRVAPSARVAQVAQPTIVTSGSGGAPNASRPARKGVSLATLGWAVLAVVVLAAAVATPLLLRRHRNKQDTPP